MTEREELVDYLDRPMRRWYATGTLVQLSKPRRNPYAAIFRLSRSNAEHVPDKIPGRGATPAVHWRTPAPALAKCVVAIDEELLPASHEVKQELGPTCERHRIMHGIAEERLGDDHLPLGIPVNVLDSAHLLRKSLVVIATGLAAHPGSDNEPIRIGHRTHSGLQRPLGARPEMMAVA